MKQKKIFFLLISILILSVLVMISCPASDEDGKVEGKVTVNLTNGETANGHYVYAYVYTEGETDVNNSATVLAVNYTVISGGSATMDMEEDDGSWLPNGTLWKGTGGSSYDIYIYTDSDDDNNPGTGESKMTDPMPILFTIDGDETINVDYTEMIDYLFD